MIKLNNKKITYVALADSNNSVKGVKEIWYADSANSVKLVYRRKDALIEGEDYEKYHWLQGRNGAHINTMHPLTTYDDAFYVKAHFDGTIKNPNNGEQNIFGYTHLNNNTITDICRLYINSSGRISCNYYIPDGNWSPLPDSLGLTDIEVYSYAVGNNHYVNLKDTLHTLSTNGMQQQTFGSFIALFSNNGDDDNGARLSSRYFHGDIASFRISDPTFTTDKLHLIPCKLLKPVPKWLDANGIRRQVGECGMIDLVSGKFYGNVNSVGTFTVENYYERKEWLKGDCVAYIDTNVIVNVATLLISTKIHRSNSTGNYFIFGSRDILRSDDPSTSSVVVSPQSFRCDIIDGNNIFDSSSIASIELSFPTLTINGQSSTTQRVPTTSQNTFRIFTTSVVNSGTYCFNGGISEFVLNDGTHSLDLIPCTLTMDLPASMDANNIARTKGTSGMWDLVSDKFYGNVANSGTFKAVNLAEGVDYEVHDWLGVSVSTKVEMTILPVNSPNLYFKHRHIRGVNYHYFITTGEGVDYDYFYDSDTYRCSVWNLSNSTRVYYTQDITEDEIVINCNSSNRYVNGYDIPIYGSTIKQVSIISRNQNGFEGLISSITVDGVERYIPCKLLKSIPAKYDANGIARQAGECGMYDTVNDVFYGNVASSGTFSVSDDS